MSKNLQDLIERSADLLASGVPLSDLRTTLFRFNHLPQEDMNTILSSSEDVLHSRGTHTRAQDNGTIMYRPHNGITIDSQVAEQALIETLKAYVHEDTDEVFKARDIRDDGNLFIVKKDELEHGVIPLINPLPAYVSNVHNAPIIALGEEENLRDANQSLYIGEVNPLNRDNKKMAEEKPFDLATEAKGLLQSGTSPMEVRKILRSKYPAHRNGISSAMKQATAKIVEEESALPTIDTIEPHEIPKIIPVDRAKRAPTETPASIVVAEFDSEPFFSTTAQSSPDSDPVPTIPSAKKEEYSFMQRLGLGAGITLAAGIAALTLGNAAWPYLQNLYTSLSTEQQKVVQQSLPQRANIEAPEVPLETETLEEKIKTPRIIEAPTISENKIFSYDGTTVTITPLPGYGLTTYAALFTDKEPAELSLLSFEEQKALLREKRNALGNASKADLREILTITTNIAEANPDDVYRESLTLEGIKDPTKNVIYAGVPLELPYKEEEKKTKEETKSITKAPVKGVSSSETTIEAVLPQRKKKEGAEQIFTYHVRDPNDPLDDKITIDFALAGVGTSQYVTVLVEQGWNRENLYDLAQWLPSEQVTRAREANTTHIKSLDADARAQILELTKEIIQDSLNSSEVYHVDLSEQGIKDGKNNVVYRNHFLIVSPPSENAKPFIPEDVQNSLDQIVEANLRKGNLPQLHNVIRDYFELRHIERDIPFLADEKLMAELVTNIAQKYNSHPENILIDPMVTREEHILLAQDLYQITGDASNRRVYMTKTEILDLVSEGLTEKITLQDLETEVTIDSPLQDYPLPERKVFVQKVQRKMKERTTETKILPPAKEISFTPQTLSDNGIGEDPLSDIPTVEEVLGPLATVPEYLMPIIPPTATSERPVPEPVQRITITEDPRIAQHTLIPSQVQAYMNIWEMLLDTPGANIDEAKTVLEPLAYRISEDYERNKIEQLNLNPLPKALRLALATDLQNLGAMNYIPKERIFAIVNAGYAPSHQGYITESDLQTSLMAPSPYTITVQTEKTSESNLETILKQTEQSYETIQEPKQAQKIYFTARNLEEKNVLTGHEASEKILTQLVTQYKDGKDLGVKELKREERLAVAAQLYSSPDFADKRYGSYMTAKDMEEMLSPEGLEAVSIRDMREAGKESFGRTRRDAQVIARDLRREEVYSLYLVKKQDNEDLTPYAFSQMKDVQEDLHMKAATIKRDIDWNISLSGEE